MPQFPQTTRNRLQYWGIRKYFHDEDMEDHDTQSKENEVDVEEHIGIYDLMNKQLQG